MVEDPVPERTDRRPGAGAIGRALISQKVSSAQFTESMDRYTPGGDQMLLDYWSDTVAEPDVALPISESLTASSARTLATWAQDHAGDFG